MLFKLWNRQKFQPPKVDEKSERIYIELTKNHIPQKCTSDPSLDKYIRKPKFSRDIYDYDTKREKYSPRKLVCPEKMTYSEAHRQAKFTLESCNDTPDSKSVLSILAPTSEKDFFSDSKFYSNESNSESAWVLLGHNFNEKNDESYSNFERMVREGEEQNADIVSAWVWNLTYHRNIYFYMSVKFI